MRKIILLLTIFLLSSQIANSQAGNDSVHVYDNFETGTIAADRWTGGTKSADTITVLSGTYSMKITSGVVQNASQITNWTNTVFSCFIRQENDAAGDDLTLSIFGQGLDIGYPTSSYWGKAIGAGWQNTGISSLNGRADATNNWMRFRSLINKTDNNVKTILGNNTLDIDVSGINSVLTYFQIQKQPSNVYVDNCTYWNYDFGGWNGTFGDISDTTPPSITYYNLTSDSRCESWNTDKNTACVTSSVNPSVQFNTSENAYCAIAGSSSPTNLNINYTQMSSFRNCTGGASGEGTINHFCVLTSEDELVYDTSYLFISCKDLGGNENLTSTSGPLKVSVSGLESAGRTAIGIGVQNALLLSYTNYTDQQVYARDLSNNQAKGTFDWFVKKDSKAWAFNKIGISDSHVNMFNLTPVLYTLEFANKTTTNIAKEVELLINLTK